MNPKNAGKWRAERPARSNTGSSIRGKTISHPIPFPDDDEFPIRTPGAGIALPMGPEALEREIRLRTSIATEELHPTQPPPGTDSEQSIAQTTTYSTHRSVRPDPKRAHMSTPLRNSVADSLPSGSSAGRPERKKSSLKSVLGRLFGRKRKPSSSTIITPTTDSLRAGHRSDPSALTRHPPEHGSSSKRSASLPINEFNRALRSHSIAAEDIPQSIKSSLRNRDSVQSNVQRRSRRATTPSRLWTPNKTPGYVDWTGLSPRPASTHARGSAIISDAEANLIGTAVTSGSHPNRRSRSMGEMRNTVLMVSRRRSDEIKYWRESYDATILSPMSSNKADADEPILVDEEDARDVQPQEPPQPFNFGPLGALAGMKITEVASLETRVLRLEDRMMKMERLISRSLENLNSNAPPPLQDPMIRRSPGRASSIPRPKTKDSETSIPRSSRFREQQEQQYRNEPMPQMRSSSYGSSRRPSTTHSQNTPYHPYDTNEVQPQVPSDPAHGGSTARPLSTSTTIRGLPPSPSTSRDGVLTAEHYTALTNMILSEQSARQNLEILVLSLQEQIHILNTRALSPRISALNEKLDPNTAFSTFEQDDSSDDGRRYGDENDEVFRTPNEETVGGRKFGDEIFGDVLRNSATEELTGVARTLSLSQITQGKTQKQQVGVRY